MLSPSPLTKKTQQLFCFFNPARIFNQCRTSGWLAEGWSKLAWGRRSLRFCETGRRPEVDKPPRELLEKAAHFLSRIGALDAKDVLSSEKMLGIRTAGVLQISLNIVHGINLCLQRDTYGGKKSCTAADRDFVLGWRGMSAVSIRRRQELTDLGKKLARMPIHPLPLPQFGR